MNLLTRKYYIQLVSVCSLSAALSACAPQADVAERASINAERSHLTAEMSTAPVVLDLQTFPAEGERHALQPSETPGETPADEAQAIVAEVTLAKDKILNRIFLYGSDLQYSAMSDTKYGVTLQSIALGHIPAEFKILGARLQLIADQRVQFESDINHPGRLIHEFRIVRQTPFTVTIAIEKASPTLATILNGPTAGANRSSWVRSIQYVAEGNYLMFESSIEGSDGSVLEFMESVFPRETLVPADYKPILANAELEPLAKRYRFLSWGKVYTEVAKKGRIKTDIANRYNVKAGETIDWYVTPNVPDEYLGEIRTGIEGWNRYSQAMWGKDFVRFKGKLPAEIKIGDPRYNIVNWDNVAMAGAAYESQASDPLTGIQSHSLVYLPLAWFNIGKIYWERGEHSDSAEKAAAELKRLFDQRHFMGRKLPLNCLHEAVLHMDIEARQDPKAFGKELLKAVLLHEIGHALGLDHNFKGSLSWDPAKADKTAFSTSIMDYNQYHFERDAYESIESDKGPLLEYDRQIISVLYNEGTDVKTTDAVVPVCNDEETDDYTAGVDPLCIRYDAGSDPTVQLQNVIALVTDEAAKNGPTQSLPKALRQAATDLGNPIEAATVEKVAERILKLSTTVNGLTQFYFFAGAQSVSRMTKANIRSLYEFKENSLPKDYNAAEMRQRALAGLKYVAQLDKLPKATQDALDSVVLETREWLLKTPAIQALPEGAARDLQVATLIAPVMFNPNGLLAQVRAFVLVGLERKPTAPFYMEVGANGLLDMEAASLALLENGLTSEVNGKTRGTAERVAYLTALKTYLDTAEGKAAVERVKTQLQSELHRAKDSRAREELRGLMKLL